jgi:hypothetical protein
VDAIDGLMPNKSKHEFYIDVAPGIDLTITISAENVLD